MADRVVPDAVHFLVVEDDDIDVERVRRAFKKQNFANPLHRALCGIEALEILRGQNGRTKIPQPCVMLVDINMPRMNGLEFLKEVRSDAALRKNVAFVLTTSARESDIESAYALDAAGYFLKEDVDNLTQMLGHYREINRFSRM